MPSISRPKSIFLLSIFLLSLFLLRCGGGTGEEKDDSINAERIYETRCASCHGMDGEKGLSGAVDLTASRISMEERIKVIKNGRGAMIPFQGILNDREIRAVAEYLDKFSKAE
jgi:mono/diheme cytochrome c family protein